MLSPFRFAGIMTVIFAVCGPARAQQIAPAGSGVTINKIVVDNGPAHTVKYYVQGGSPRVQALVRRVEWTENELSVIEQLQLLKLDTVVNERRVASFRTAQLTNPYWAPGFIPLSIGTDNGCDGASSLQRALTGQLAYEATPQAALQLIGFLEQQQTQLDAELKALPPQEKKAAQGPVDALRPRLAALPRSDVPPPPPQPVVTSPVVNPPVVTRQVTFPAQAVPQQSPMPLDPIAGNQIEVEWGQTWWPAEILRVQGNEYLIHYTGFDASWDEWVNTDRIRSRQNAPRSQPVVSRQVTFPAQAVPQQLPMPLDTAAFEQMVRQNQEKVRQQIAQTHQQIMQRHQEILQQHQLPFMGLRR
jgi:hypothetical protein